MNLDDALRVDPDREGHQHGATGIYIRAVAGEAPNRRWWYDIAELDTASLNAFLRSRGGENEWAESVVRILLGHPS